MLTSLTLEKVRLRTYDLPNAVQQGLIHFITLMVLIGTILIMNNSSIKQIVIAAVVLAVSSLVNASPIKDDDKKVFIANLPTYTCAAFNAAYETAKTSGDRKPVFMIMQKSSTKAVGEIYLNEGESAVGKAIILMEDEAQIKMMYSSVFLKCKAIPERVLHEEMKRTIKAMTSVYKG
jgi:hypothetical protein